MTKNWYDMFLNTRVELSTIQIIMAATVTQRQQSTALLAAKRLTKCNGARRVGEVGLPVCPQVRRTRVVQRLPDERDRVDQTEHELCRVCQRAALPVPLASRSTAAPPRETLRCHSLRASRSTGGRSATFRD